MFYAGVRTVDRKFWGSQLETVCDITVCILSIQPDLSLNDIVTAGILLAVLEFTVENKVLCEGKIFQGAYDPDSCFADGFFEGCIVINH